MWTQNLSRFDLQLAYLVMLTHQGLKPLSRWEGCLNDEAQDTIRSSGLVLDTVTRRTLMGRKCTETIFALDKSHTDLYQRRFHDTVFKHTPDRVRLEGQLFGYPPCCVDTFIRNPYVQNRLCPEDQEILFHWACRDCLITPELLREYRLVHNETLQLFGSQTESAHRPLPRPWSNTGKIAASLALLLGTVAMAAADDPHQLPIADDLDQDFLSYAEEVVRGTDWWNPDTDQDFVLDGVQTALLLKQLIDSPPPGVEVTDHMVWGFETCSICAETANMGYVLVTHEQRGLSAVVPYIALHYLEHGSLSFDGSIHTGRTDFAALKQILLPCDPAHLLPWYDADLDHDGLATEEELLLGTDPENPDTDGDSLEDGPQAAENLLPLIAALPREETPDSPYLLEWQADGVEQCEVCGITLNMGFAELVNPMENMSVQIPFVGLHTLAHGGFVFDGSYNYGRILPTVLRSVLTGDGTSHWLPVAGDADGDGMLAQEEIAFAMDPENPDENENGVPDGRELAQSLASQVQALPVGPLPDQIYALDHWTLGFYNCLICGEEINMGFREVVNPMEDRSIFVPFYNLHCMEHGSFSTDREDIYPRMNPREIALVLGSELSAIEPGQEPPAFAFRNWPNPFHAASNTTIVLSLPQTAGAIEIAIFDAAGRKVRELYSGQAQEQAFRFVWDGRSNDGGRVSAGVYFCRVTIGSVAVSRKMTLLQ